MSDYDELKGQDLEVLCGGKFARELIKQPLTACPYLKSPISDPGGLDALPDLS